MSVSAISSGSGYWEELYGLSSKRDPSAQDIAQKLFADLDSDESKGLSLEESGLEQSLFSAMDSDGNGMVSIAELEAALENSAMFARMQAGLPQPPPANNHDFAQKLFDDLDTDGSQGLSLEESGLDQALFNALDSDGNGTVSISELETALENAAMAAPVQAGIPEAPPAGNGERANAQDVLAAIMNSGEASEATAVAATGATAGSGGGGGGGDSDEYDALDTNEDGVVSAEELRAAMRNGTLGGTGVMSMLMGLFSSLADNSYNAASKSLSDTAAVQSLNVTA